MVAHHHRSDRRRFPAAASPAYVPVSGPDPLSAARPREQTLHRALDALPAEVREVLQLIYWHELRPVEVAHVIELPVADVRAMTAAGLSQVALALHQGSDAPS